MRQPPARVGGAVEAIETPALVIDLDALERNIERMAAFARTNGLRLRPHAKTHKSARIARMQMAAGAVGVCVQKVSEAEALAAGGVADIYISNEVIAEDRLARVAVLAGRVRLAIAVDSALGVERLVRAMQATGNAIDVFVEVDVGQGRCGVPPAAAGALAHQVVSHGLHFAGLQAYHGGAQHLRTPAEREAAIARAAGQAALSRDLILAAGLPCPVITGAGSGTYMLEAASGVYNELQPGSYAFMDADYGRNTEETPFAHSLFILASVMSRAPDRAVLDVGLKAHSIDSGMPLVHADAGGRPLKGLEYRKASDEHGVIFALEGAALPALGDKLRLIPGHIDPTVNLHDWIVGVRQGRVESLWPVSARGAMW